MTQTSQVIHVLCLFWAQSPLPSLLGSSPCFSHPHSTLPGIQGLLPNPVLSAPHFPQSTVLQEFRGAEPLSTLPSAVLCPGHFPAPRCLLRLSTRPPVPSSGLNPTSSTPAEPGAYGQPTVMGEKGRPPGLLKGSAFYRTISLLSGLVLSDRDVHSCKHSHGIKGLSVLEAPLHRGMPHSPDMHHSWGRFTASSLLMDQVYCSPTYLNFVFLFIFSISSM